MPNVRMASSVARRAPFGITRSKSSGISSAPCRTRASDPTLRDPRSLLRVCVLLDGMGGVDALPKLRAFTLPRSYGADWLPHRREGSVDVSDGICFAGLDVHARSTAAAAIQLGSGEVWAAQLGGSPEAVIEWLCGLPVRCGRSTRPGRPASGWPAPPGGGDWR